MLARTANLVRNWTRKRTWDSSWPEGSQLAESAVYDFARYVGTGARRVCAGAVHDAVVALAVQMRTENRRAVEKRMLAECC